MSSERSSLTFDRAAGYYDKTRGLPPEGQARVTQLLTRELSGRGRALEIGIGTGRIGLSLHTAGIDVTGVDLSEAMLQRLIDNAGGSSPLPLARADGTKLPFADDSFGAAYTCHVLHLIPEWKRVLIDVVRVVKKGGVYLNDIGGWQQMSGPRPEMLQYFASAAGFDITPRGADDASTVDRFMISVGATVRPLRIVTVQNTHTYSEVIDHLERGMWSCTWQASEEARRRGGLELRRWASRRYGDLSQSFTYSVPIRWCAYDL
jgi:ubiquinone/menaquinone biosynthesis C-methylase UbiE